MNMKKNIHKIYSVFSIRNIAFIVLTSFLTSCVSPTYPVSTNHNSPHNQSYPVADPAVATIAGVATVGAIAYYVNKKHDNRKHHRIKHKPAPVKVIKPVKSRYKPHPVASSSRPQVIKSIKNSHNRSTYSARPVVKYAQKRNHDNVRRQRATQDARNKLIQKRNGHHNNATSRNSTRNPQNTRRQTIERTREQLQQRRSGDQNVTVNTASASSETNRNRNRKASRKNQQ